MYFILFIAFLVAAYFVTKNKKLMESISGMTAAKEYATKMAGAQGVNSTGDVASDILIDLGNDLGLEYKKLASTGNQKELYSMGGRLSGNYEGIPVEIIMEAHGEENKTLNVAVQFSYSYTHDKRVVMHVKNPNGKKFEINARSKNIISTPTGKTNFDSKLQLTGDTHVVPSEVLDFAAKSGWINLKLNNDQLTFIDDYYEQPEFKTMTGGMKMMTAVHPIWGTSVQKPKMEASKVRELLDVMVKIANNLS